MWSSSAALTIKDYVHCATTTGQRRWHRSKQVKWHSWTNSDWAPCGALTRATSDHPGRNGGRFCTRYGYGGNRVRRIRVLPVQAHRRSCTLNLRVSTGGRNVHSSIGSTSTEVLVLIGSGVSYMFEAVLRRGLQLRGSGTASRKLGG